MTLVLCNSSLEQLDQRNMVTWRVTHEVRAAFVSCFVAGLHVCLELQQSLTQFSPTGLRIDTHAPFIARAGTGSAISLPLHRPMLAKASQLLAGKSQSLSDNRGFRPEGQDLRRLTTVGRLWWSYGRCSFYAHVALCIVWGMCAHSDLGTFSGAHVHYEDSLPHPFLTSHSNQKSILKQFFV